MKQAELRNTLDDKVKHLEQSKVLPLPTTSIYIIESV